MFETEYKLPNGNTFRLYAKSREDFFEAEIFAPAQYESNFKQLFTEESPKLLIQSDCDWENKQNVRQLVRVSFDTRKQRQQFLSLKERVPSDVHLYFYYNCYSWATKSMLQAHGIPVDIVRGMAKVCLCESFGLLYNNGILSPDMVVTAQAEGQGPGEQKHNMNDRRALFDYYQRHFGFELIDQTTDMTQPVLHEIPIRAKVSTILQHC